MHVKLTEIKLYFNLEKILKKAEIVKHGRNRIQISCKVSYSIIAFNVVFIIRFVGITLKAFLEKQVKQLSENFASYVTLQAPAVTKKSRKSWITKNQYID